MFKLKDGRDFMYQWDINRQIVVDDPSITEVHFSNRADEDSLPVEVYEENGLRLANVPNILLQEDLKIKAYAYSVDHTKYEAWFYVTSKSKPADYVYTETEVINYNSLLDKLSGKVDKSDILTEVDTSEVYTDNQFYNANVVNSVIDLLVDKNNILTEINYNASADDIYNAIVINGITQQINETFATKAYVNEVIGGIENGSY